MITRYNGQGLMTTKGFRPRRQRQLGFAIGIAMLVSASLLAAALAFQYIGGLQPCTLCHWQRWPHMAVILFGFVFLLTSGRFAGLVLLLISLAALTTAAIGFWHAGVELGWLQGPTACSGGFDMKGEPAQLVDKLLAGPVVRCDEVPWSLLGISMAGWNGLISLALAGFSGWLVFRSR